MHVRIIYEKTKGQVPLGPLLGKQNIQAIEVYSGGKSAVFHSQEPPISDSPSCLIDSLQYLNWCVCHTCLYCFDLLTLHVLALLPVFSFLPLTRK